jgi:glutaredoxin
MDITEPSLIGFTIYSKSGCSNCTKVKNMLKTSNLSFNVVDCDEYILENKEFFLSFMEKKIGHSYRFFPIVFHDNKFIGGFSETSEYVEKILLSFEDNF